jgi:N-acylneuraminate cytidylyltransferase
MRVVIIPARGGSKGIPKKNLSLLNGVTLVRRALLASLESDADCVILSTDDESIAKEANGLNVVVHNRSSLNSMDQATSESVISEVIEEIGSAWAGTTLIGMVQATSPFTSGKLIDRCFKTASGGFTSFTAGKSHKLLWRETSDGWQPVNHPVNRRIRRQDMESEVFETGAVYVFQLDAFRRTGYRFCSPPMPIIENNAFSVDIDSPVDLILAEIVLNHPELNSSLEWKVE